MRTGFTLVELAAVILILAIMAAAVTINLGSPLEEARFQDVQIEIESFLAVVRTVAVRTGQPTEVLLDINDNALIYKPVNPSGYMREKRLDLPEAYGLRRVISQDGEATMGYVKIRYTAQGLSVTYAMILGEKERPRVLLVSGLGGQIMVCEDETAARNIFEALAMQVGLPDAD